MRTKTYTVLQQPIPWSRARLNGKNFFDAQKTEKLVFGIYLQQQHNDEPLFSGPLELDITFYLQQPEALTKKINKTKDTTLKNHTARPDLDNLCKFVLDAIQSVLISDDKIIYAIHAKKMYDTNPRTEFTIKEM